MSGADAGRTTEPQFRPGGGPAEMDDRRIALLREAIEAPDLEGTRYRLVRELGRGGMGTVFLVEDRTLGREVALKVLGLADPDGTLSARLLREARLLARLEHPHIVPVHDAGTLADGRVFYAMKYVRGQRLDAWREGLALPALLRTFLRICDAVAFAHDRGIIHRDLKPENVMVGPFGEALVMDWGVARALRETGGEASRDEGSGTVPTAAPSAPEAASSLDTGAPPQPPVTRDGTVVGTAAYMAPEQARGEIGAVDERADVYALGGILHFLLSGRPPEGADASPRGGGAEISRALDAICVKALRAEAIERYATAAELARDVERYLEGEPVSARKENVIDWAVRIGSHNAPILWLIAGYLLMRTVWLALSGR